MKFQPTGRGLSAAVLVLALASLSSPLRAANLNWFAQFDAFDGCSTDAQHINWVDFTDLHHLLFINDSGGLADPDREPFIISKPWDCASVDIWDHFRKGTVFGQITLEGVETGALQLLMQRIVLENARFESLETAFEDPAPFPTERLRLEFTKITMDSFCFDNSGVDCGTESFCFDFATNMVC